MGVLQRAGAALAAAVWLAPAATRATYSIAAVDLESGQAGGAGTSCVGSQLSVYEIFGAAPGFGVVMAQAALNTEARDRALELLAQGRDAPDVMAQITSANFDFASAIRQYAVIDARGAAAGFTGDSTMPYADDVQGRAGDVVYSVQGNILTGAAVLEQAAVAFEAPGCDLADTLMRALAAGADNGEGDSRCTPDGIPSDGAFIRVDLANGDPDAPFLELQVDDTRPDDPIADLRALYDAWRLQHPCPMPEPDTSPDASTAVPDAGTAVPDAGTATPDAATSAPGAGAGAQGGSAATPPAAGTAGGTAGTGTEPAAPIAGSTAGSGTAGSAGTAATNTPLLADGGSGGGCAIAAPAARAGGRGAALGCAALAAAALAAAVRFRARARRRLSAPPRA